MNKINNISLPNEMWVKIFSYVEMSDLVILELVSKQFNSISKENMLWKNFAMKRGVKLKNNQELSIKEIVLKNVVIVTSFLKPILNPKDNEFFEKSNIFQKEQMIMNEINTNKNQSKIHFTKELHKEENLKNIKNAKLLVRHGARPNNETFKKFLIVGINNKVFNYLKEVAIQDIISQRSNLKKEVVEFLHATLMTLSGLVYRVRSKWLYAFNQNLVDEINGIFFEINRDYGWIRMINDN